MTSPTLFPTIPFDGHDDVIIIGGGLAGLFCALKLAPRPVTILAAADLGAGASSAWAQGGIAAAVSEGDTIEAHLADTLKAGCGLVNEAHARMMISEAPERIHDLLSYGVPFDQDLEGKLMVSREAAHSRARVVRVSGDKAGRAIMAALIAAVKQTPSIRVFEGFTAEKLITEGRSIVGVQARALYGQARNALSFKARAIVLATGGIGHLYSVTTNPLEASGTGLGMAARIGAKIQDAEFVQFHPTAIHIGVDPAPLATEALRGEGALLVDGEGKRFMVGLHKDAELAPRDIVARAVYAVQKKTGAFLDARIKPGAAFPEKFPTVYEACVKAGLNPLTDLIPIAPAAHYHMGGVMTDANARTTIDGLWAIGEVACTGVHGANRLASNSLLEAVVFAARAAQDIAQNFPDPQKYTLYGEIDIEEQHKNAQEIEAIKYLRQLMTSHVGVLRNDTDLQIAVDDITALLKEAQSDNLKNTLSAALCIASAALKRRESVGAHFREDQP